MEAAALRQDIHEAQFYMDRLQRRYLNEQFGWFRPLVTRNQIAPVRV